MKLNPYSTTDEYLANFSDETREKLEMMRKTIKEVAPEAKEKIAYGIPTFTYHGNLVHFGGYKGHVSLFPGAAPVEMFKEQLKGYETSKGTIQFPLDKPLPIDLIRKIVLACVERNKQKKSKK